MTGQIVSPRSRAAVISLDLGLDLLLDDGEDLLDGAARGGDAGPQRRLDLPDRGRQIGGRLLPVRQGGQRAVRCGRHGHETLLLDRSPYLEGL